MRFSRNIALAAWALIAAPAVALALEPRQIALIVNRAAPESLDLAKFYVQARAIPESHIIELDLPTTEEIPFDRYERDVTPPVRQFLRSRGLEGQIRCLVTFYGVPTRISDRVNGPRENNELQQLRTASTKALARLETEVKELETVARQFEPEFSPAINGQNLEALAQRLTHGMVRLQAAALATDDPAVRQRIAAIANEFVKRLSAPVDIGAPASQQSPASIPATAPTTAQVMEMVERPFDPETRAELREQARLSGGMVGYAKILQNQIDYLNTEATGSALDNELALLWWPAYPRVRWQPNALNPHFKLTRAPPTVMVMRLDAPSPQAVRDLVANSLATEREGLSGKLVVDSRGIAPKDANGQHDSFGVFDERLRRLASFVQDNSDIPVMLDDNPNVLAPNSVDDVAMYCGWYSVRNYVPGMKFNRGAVGYHVASFEMVNLRGPQEGGWVQNLLAAGVVGTVGPVAEPYLHSFPAPDEFFPLLMTGKLTLAEVYWTTTPLTSWMQSCIGDPLYNPWQKSPAMKLEDLPPLLKSAIQAP